MRWLPRELRPSRKNWTAIPLFVGVVSFVGGALIGTLNQPRQTQAAKQSTREQHYDAAYAKACEESNGVVVVRFPKPNGLECAWSGAIQPLGPEAKPR